MAEQLKLLETTIYSYDTETGLRFKYSHLHPDIKGAWQWIMLEKLGNDLAGYTIDNLLTDKREDEWWDRKARVFWSTGKDGEQAN